MRILAAWLCLLVAACGSRSSAQSANGDGGPPSSVTVSAAPPGQKLDEDGPRMDLYLNRFRFHLRGHGLVIPVAGPGLWKYSNEYTSPWGGIVQQGGKSGRTLSKRAATLRFPWTALDQAGGASPRVALRLLGAPGQRLSVNLNGKNLRNTTMAGGWQTIEMPVPAGLLRVGENRLLVSVSRPGTLVHSIEIGPPAAAPAPGAEVPYPPLDPSPAGSRSLSGYLNYSIPVEIPAEAGLRLATQVKTGSARFRVAAKAVGENAVVLLDEVQMAGAARERSIALASLAGKLVTLELSLPEGDAAAALWSSPRMLLPQVAVRAKPVPVENVLLIVVDALRADRLALNVTTPVRTPRITEAGKARGAVFRKVVAPSPSSPPSHASIQTGQTPRVHGVGGDKAKPSPGIPAISAVLGKLGVATAFFGDNSFAMDRLRAQSAWTAYHQPNREGAGSDCSAIVKGTFGFIDEQVKAKKRFFVSTLPFEPHSPYVYHAGVTERYFPGPFDPALGKHIAGETVEKIAGGGLPMTPARWAQLRGTYDGEVDHFDGCFGAILDGLEQRGLLDKTAIVLTGDHGEGFGEHHKVGHAYGHWFEVIDVPLVILSPGLVDQGIVIDVPASGIDIAPTVLDLMGFPPDARMQGESLVPMILRRGSWPSRVATSEYGRSYSFRASAYRYIVEYSGTELLYDLAKDPREQAALGENQPEVLRYFRDLAGFYLAYRSAWRGTGWGSLDNHGPALAGAGEKR